MALFGWFDAGEAEAFGRELARFVLEELQGDLHLRDKRFELKAEKTLRRASRRVQAFREIHTLNAYKRSRLANAFLWTLKDARCPPEYADRMTEWLVVRL